MIARQIRMINEDRSVNKPEDDACASLRPTHKGRETNYAQSFHDIAYSP